ncbi:MAG: replication factor C large subunit [Candidatus Pacearchaeota archaeon]
MINQKNIPWSEKYRPSSYSFVRGQELAIERVRTFLRNFPKKRAIVLYGPAGVGKTSLAYVVAAETDSEILELNASDFRDKQKISSIIGPASLQGSLFGKYKIILVDEIEGISSSEKGGLPELLALIERTSFPIIITANDIWDKKFSLLREKAEIVQLRSLDYKLILNILEEICKKENIAVSKDILLSIAIKARGDARAAINDLQSLSNLDESVLAKEIEERNKEQSIFNAMHLIFKSAKIDDRILKVYDEVNMTTDEIFLWIEENIPVEYKGEELAKAFDALSRADVFRGRVHRQQHWRFLVYQNFFIGPAIAASKKYNRPGMTNYRKPSRILKIWLQNQRNKKKLTICEKYAKACHISIKQAMKDFLLIRLILKNDNIKKQLKLTEDEIEYLDKPIVF